LGDAITRELDVSFPGDRYAAAEHCADQHVRAGQVVSEERAV
jgi:hypothetical protein